MKARLFGAAVAGIVAVTMMAVVSLQAHHSFAAEYDAEKPVTLKGTIVKMDWVNPHSWLWIDVKRSDGTVENWKLEFGALNALLRRGWRRESLPIGTEVTVEGFRARDGSLTANGSDVTLPDGKKLFAGSSGTGAPYERR